MTWLVLCYKWPSDPSLSSQYTLRHTLYQSPSTTHCSKVIHIWLNLTKYVGYFHWFLPFCIGYIYTLFVFLYYICMNLWCWYPKYSKQVGGGHLKWQVEKVKCSQRLFTHVCSMTLGPRILVSVFKVTVSTVFSVKVFKSKVFDCVCLVFRHWGLKCSLKTVDGHRSRLKSINPRRSSCSPLLYLKPANLQSTSLKSTQVCFNNFRDYKDYKLSMMIHDHHLLLWT